MVARAAQLPVLEPSDSSEAKEFMKIAFDLSESLIVHLYFAQRQDWHIHRDW